MIVVDVGAMRQGPEESTLKLIGRFQPQLVLAFDPHPDYDEGVYTIDGTVVVQRRLAAWTHNGTVPLHVDGICTGVDKQGQPARCFDLADFLRVLPATDELVLKLDCEGSEYPLLDVIYTRQADERLTLVLVEWHPPETAHGWYTTDRPTLRCPVEAWE